MRRTDLLDTSEWAHREWVRRLRAMSPEEKISLALELTDLGGEIQKTALAEATANRPAGCDDSQ